MPITPDQVAEWDAAETAANDARRDDGVAQEDLRVATARAQQTAQARTAAEAREAAAEAAILPQLQPGEMRGLHPEPVAIVMRNGDKLVRGTLHSIHGEGK